MHIYCFVVRSRESYIAQLSVRVGDGEGISALCLQHVVMRSSCCRDCDCILTPILILSGLALAKCPGE